MKSRLVSQINYLDGEAARLREAIAAGKAGKRLRYSPDRLQNQARDLQARHEARMADLTKDAALTARPPTLSAVMLVIPAGLIGWRGIKTPRTQRSPTPARSPPYWPLSAPGHPSRRRCPQQQRATTSARFLPDADGVRGPTVFIEVKGRSRAPIPSSSPTTRSCTAATPAPAIASPWSRSPRCRPRPRRHPLPHRPFQRLRHRRHRRLRHRTRLAQILGQGKPPLITTGRSLADAVRIHHPDTAYPPAKWCESTTSILRIHHRNGANPPPQRRTTAAMMLLLAR